MEYNVHSYVYYGLQSLSHGHRCCFCSLKISYLYVLDSVSLFMGAAIFLPKPRKDKQQDTLLTNGLKYDFTHFFFILF